MSTNEQNNTPTNTDTDTNPLLEDEYISNPSQEEEEEDEEDSSSTVTEDSNNLAAEEAYQPEDEAAAAEEIRNYEAARREQAELMAAETQKLTADKAPDNRLQYLLAQSEVFAHFLAGSVAAVSSKKSKKGSKKAHRGRMSEAAEDAQLMKSAQSTRAVTRLAHQPTNLADHCKMHPYQLEGLNWLIKLHDNGINGILADEMGLGKTLQTISLLAYLRESRGIRGPHIVIVPKSVVGNWNKEFKKWCPCIKVIRMLGTKEERKKCVAQVNARDSKGRHTFDVLVTSYEGVLKEKGTFSKVNWRYLIIDEAHRIKNEKSSLSKVVRTFPSQFRVLITGTPLQNNLHELWALLNFLLPDIFGDAEQFDEWFSLKSGDGQDNVIKKLHTVLRPFMLRRVKKDVAHTLPPKTETKLYIGLTKVQQQWYTKILSKDAHELNALGGPDRVRLLNILMQLRKVCNHPYLFDGAEPGPPFTDGPHLWEASGKMMLLHKLLPKLKAKGSRVLIFCQMTRVLDILEDYFRLVGHEYCRIDGNTDGDVRDNSMEEFNAPNSTKFAFLLSTRAGGLGINLATADIVILFDSDWNPQVDLQAMDRAHRIGQTKPVQVFRFVSEGTVEEKIIERADRKLFLDAAVIQQGRLAEKHSSLDKKELEVMVKFGADAILNSKGGTYSDEDIDALIARGAERTKAISDKLKTDAQHNLASFSLLDTSGEASLMTFKGEDYSDKKKGGNFINLPSRQRKRNNYDMDDYYQRATGEVPAAKKRRRGPTTQDFQLFDKDRLEELNEEESDLAALKQARLAEIKDLRCKAKHAPSINNSRTSITAGQSCEELLAKAKELEEKLSEFDVSEEFRAEKEALMNEGFPDWTKKDFKLFCSSLERRGRFDVANIVNDVVVECGKNEDDVKKYYIAFWTNYQRISDWKKILERIEKGEKRINRVREIRSLIQNKVERHLTQRFGEEDANQKLDNVDSNDDYCKSWWEHMSINYGAGVKGRAYTHEEDAFLICAMYKHGYGAAERIRMDIRKVWQFRFDWYFKSRNAAEIQKRCEILVKVLEREEEELQKKEANTDSMMVDSENPGNPSTVPIEVS